MQKCIKMKGFVRIYISKMIDLCMIIWYLAISNQVIKIFDDILLDTIRFYKFYTSPGKSLAIIHLSRSLLAACFSLKNLAENCLAFSSIFSSGNCTWEALYKLNVGVIAWLVSPRKQKNSPPSSKYWSPSVTVQKLN